MKLNDAVTFWLMDQPAITTGQADDLKLDTVDPGRRMHYRVWVSRMTPADGAASFNEVTVERRHTDTGGEWLTGTRTDLAFALSATGDPEAVRLSALV